MKGLGSRIKTLRKAKKITLVEMSKKSGIDPATLSRMENGIMVGTVGSHMKIAEVLGLKLPDLYGDVVEKLNQEKDEKLRKKLASFSHSRGAVAELLTTGVMQKKMMPLIFKFKGGGRTEMEQLPVFTERFIFVVKGKFEIAVGKEKRVLEEGESLYFDASEPHQVVNLTKSEGRCLSIATPTAL